MATILGTIAFSFPQSRRDSKCLRQQFEKRRGGHSSATQLCRDHGRLFRAERRAGAIAHRFVVATADDVRA
jgi:hypothetical protein